jgi:hypothetical protein
VQSRTSRTAHIFRVRRSQMIVSVRNRVATFLASPCTETQVKRRVHRTLRVGRFWFPCPETISPPQNDLGPALDEPAPSLPLRGWDGLAARAASGPTTARTGRRTTGSAGRATGSACWARRTAIGASSRRAWHSGCTAGRARRRGGRRCQARRRRIRRHGRRRIAGTSRSAGLSQGRDRRHEQGCAESGVQEN